VFGVQLMLSHERRDLVFQGTAIGEPGTPAALQCAPGSARNPHLPSHWSHQPHQLTPGTSPGLPGQRGRA
jgi:hypothetical protein